MNNISVVIPTRHRNKNLEECLKLLSPEEQNYPAEAYEIIVSDDGNKSTAESLIQNKFSWVKWVKGPAKGPAANRNNGVKYAKFDWIAFTDDDCLPSKNWLKSFNEAIEANPEINVFEGKTEADRIKRRFNEVAPINAEGGLLWSCNLMVKKSYYLKLGGYCEDFKFELEDIEFRTRVQKDKQPIIFVPKAHVCHPWRIINNRYKVEYESVLIFLDKHPDHQKHYNLSTRLKIITMMIFNLFRDAFKFRFRGIDYALIDLLYEFKSAFVIHFKVVENQKQVRKTA
ncbi:glycosyltransferase family 2 protein [Zunongwangia sp. HRR-M8]|uniref:glycosyltransferase family 2 protein n=1 Tax=Zunongwangia sp. HRR-M8 TaxID=3015170 RepID=UPI0022DE57D8|nr:glycosyltransferase family A protein [Zunongwangia sp. HRR-M8]WBL21662.1 glycosyltransferase family A protein [Zunongwangia sp. HRR-M8]